MPFANEVRKKHGTITFESHPGIHFRAKVALAPNETETLKRVLADRGQALGLRSLIRIGPGAFTSGGRTEQDVIYAMQFRGGVGLTYELPGLGYAKIEGFDTRSFWKRLFD